MERESMKEEMVGRIVELAQWKGLSLKDHY